MFTVVNDRFSESFCVMQALPLPAATERGPGALEQLLPVLGEPDFGQQSLQLLSQVLPVASWSVYQLSTAGMHMHLSGSIGVPDTTNECWDAYRSGLYRHDSSFHHLRRASAGAHLALGHWRAQDIARAHRAGIYEPHGMCERVSLVNFDPDGLLAINLYRHDHQTSISAGALRDLQMVGYLLSLCVKRHIELSTRLSSSATAHHANPECAPLSSAEQQLPDPNAALVQRLQAMCPALTARELDVCSRLARGLTYDGIAADLQISPTTAKTYRNRAFQRLDIRHRNELFRLLLQPPTH